MTKNFGDRQLDRLRMEAQQFQTALLTADDWVQKHLKHEDQQEALQKLSAARREVRKIRRSMNTKPVFAVFGASQVGKSYLVKNLLSVDGAPLFIRAANMQVDFLKDINPPGVGAESTGVVTRFTIDKSTGDALHPVRIKLLDAKDLILILCDSYFSDIKRLGGYASENELREHARELEEAYGPNAGEQHVLVEEDILDIRAYFHDNFQRHAALVERIERSGLWTVLARCIKRIPSADWGQVIDVLWGREKHITKLFQSLLKELLATGPSPVVHAPFDTVLRGHGELLDVQRIKELGEDSRSVEILTKDGRSMQLGLSMLSALSAELTLNLPPTLLNDKPFLEHTDLLDMPGARSRLGLDAASLRADMVPDMFLRGKIAYLFNKYSTDHEINNLLFCQNDQQLDVNELPYMLNDWIATNIGRDAEERATSIQGLPVSPLFVVFTFFNNQLKYDQTNDGDLSYKWENRFTRFFEEELVTGSHDWHVNWTSEQPLFKNFFLLRDLKYSEDTYEGFETTGRETGLRQVRTEHMERVRKSFLEHPFVQRHFEDPMTMWSASTTPNADGSDAIIQRLMPAATNAVKVRNQITLLTNHAERVRGVLHKHHHVDDIAGERIRALHKGHGLQFELNRSFAADPVLFGLFLSRQMLSEAEAYAYLHENLLATRTVGPFDEYTLLRAQFPALRATNSRAENLGILRRELQLAGDEEVVSYLAEKGIEFDRLFTEHRTTSASSLIDGLLALWRRKMGEVHFEDFFQKGLPRSTHAALVSVLDHTMERAGLREKLISLVEDRVRSLAVDRGSEEYMAAVCCALLNDFVAGFGYGMLGTAHVEEIQQVAGGLGLDLSTLALPEGDPDRSALAALFADDAEQERPAPMVKEYNRYLQRLKVALLYNCGAAGYDAEANHDLSSILHVLEACTFQVEEQP
jgi:hypothetical protein